MKANWDKFSIKKVFILSRQREVLCAPTIADLYYLKTYLTYNELCTDTLSAADAILVHTCAFTENTENASVLTIQYAIEHKKKSAKIIVIGCLPAIDKKRLTENGWIGISQNQLHLLDDILPVKVGYNMINISGIGTPSELGGLPDYPLRVGWGCLGQCSYCAIRKVFGKPRSRVTNDILDEVKKAVDKGHKSFYLIANEIGCYGIDIGTDICELVDGMLNTSYGINIRLSSFAPNELLKYWKKIKQHVENGKIDYIYLACQSGSNTILNRMKRNYKIEDFYQCVELIVRSNPLTRIRTDFIIGFPGESDGDYEDSIKTISWLSKFRVRIQATPFSSRPFTEAAYMPGHLEKSLLEERIIRTKELLNTLSTENPEFVSLG